MTSGVDVRLAVLKVLGGQSPGYFIFPNASAFVAEGLDPVDVAEALEILHREGKLEREYHPSPDPETDGDGIAGGYRLTKEEPMSEPETPTTEPAPVGPPGEPEPTEPTIEPTEDDDEDGGDVDAD